MVYPGTFVSHAQNCEDVLLWRALQHVPSGYYIDVGAGDPDEISVTKAFYSRGWHGINIEPVPESHRRFLENRPRDVNLAVAAGSTEGTLTLFDLPGRPGYATADARLAERYRDEGSVVEVLQVPMQTLAQICEQYDVEEVHFLKIDVEGAEADVLAGMDFKRWRPWVLVVEATLPNTQTDSHEAWESGLLEVCYKLAHFDGLNRYYVAQEHAELLPALAIQPNVFDHFITWEQAAADEAAQQARAEAAQLRAEVTELRAKVAAIYASTSWRVSAPLRMAGRQVERLRGAPIARSARSARLRRKAGRLARLVAPGLMQRRARRLAAARRPAEARARTQIDPLLLADEAKQLNYRPMISVLVPVYNTPAHYLRLAVDSVLAQAYPEWELILCDDGSTKAETSQALQEIARLDTRIQALFLGTNCGIAAATNAALAVARGEFVAMLDHDDELLPAALLEVVKALNADRSLDVIYTDQDYIEADGIVSRTFYKPDWSLELFRGVMYVGHLLVVRRSLAERIGGFDSAFDNVQDFEFMLRLAENTRRIAHVPQILYHWRIIPGSVAFGGDEKKDIGRLQAAAVNAHFRRCGVAAIARPSPDHAHRLLIAPQPRADYPLISVVVRAPGNEADLEACCESILRVGSYPRREIIVAGGNLSSSLAKRLQAMGVVLVAAGEDSGVASLAGVGRATGEIIVSMIGDLEIQTPDWLEHLLFECELPDVGCVAPLILSSDGMVSSAGLIVGVEGLVGPAMQGLQPGGDGHAGSLSCVREVSAVSGDCFAVARRVLDELGGLSPYYARGLYQAADLSMRASSRGLRNLCTPRVLMRHRRAVPQDGQVDALDKLLLADGWDAVIKKGDPYHNPNFIQLAPGYQE